MWRKLLICLCMPMIGWSQIELQRVHLLTRPTRLEHYRAGNYIFEGTDQVQLGVVIEARIPPLHSPTFIAPFSQIIFDEDTVATARCARWGRFSGEQPLIRWFLILPERLDTIYRNSDNPLLPWVQVRYTEIPIRVWDRKWEVSLDDLPNKEQYLPGTIWLKVAVAFKGQYVATPGSESQYRLPDGQKYGGMSSAVRRITVKGTTRNTFVDNLIALRNLPLIENARSWNGYWADHQTKCWIGGNFQSFCQLAAELAGRPLLKYFNQLPAPYLNQYQVTAYYGRQVYLEVEDYKLDGRETIFLNRNSFDVGDFILKKGQCGVLFQDRSPLGNIPNRKLDRSDLVIYAQRGALQVAPLAEVFGDSLTLVNWVQRW